MKLQLIGLPGSGKSTGIELYLQGNYAHILDLQDFLGKNRERSFRSAILAGPNNTIAESACGIKMGGLYVVHLKPPMHQVYEQLLKRDNALDEDYLSLLSTQMIPAHATITRSEDVPDLLKLILPR